MEAHRPELADVVRKHAGKLLKRYTLSVQQKRVLRSVQDCRTEALGGHKKECDQCGHVEISYNSCRNRHCPKCQGAARSEWLAARQKDLLDVEYFHLVFTLPNAIGPLALQNQKVVYGILFRAVSETLRTVARDPKHLGAEIGFLAVLHTWGQNLELHPHVHCVVPGGGISLDGSRWVPCRKGFFLPVRVLSRLFRKKFLALLREARRAGELRFSGRVSALAGNGAWSAFSRKLDSQDWVVYAKPPFGGPKQVLAYLARYTHRVAISNQRLQSLDDRNVTFSWKDYKRPGHRRRMTLDAVEFLRRFLLHVLPLGFHRLRHYGFLANRVRAAKVVRCRELIDEAHRTTQSSDGVDDHSDDVEVENSPERCPRCKRGRLLIVEEIRRSPHWVLFDTS